MSFYSFRKFLSESDLLNSKDDKQSGDNGSMNSSLSGGSTSTDDDASSIDLPSPTHTKLKKSNVS